MANDEREHEPVGDAADLRAQLKLAQERLATYQKFDRDIAENVRRSSELMLEAMQVRDRVDGEATAQAQAQRNLLANRLHAIEGDLGKVQGQVAQLLERLAELRSELASEQNEETAAEAVLGEGQQETTGPGADVSDHDAPSKEEPGAEPADPDTFDLIANGMTRAALALALQSHLRGLAQVRSVDAREFSSGVLRLQLVAVGPLADEDLLGWEGDDDVTVIRHPDNVIELRIGE